MKNLNAAFASYRPPIYRRPSPNLLSRLIIIGIICLFALLLPRGSMTSLINQVTRPTPSPSPSQDPKLSALIQPLIPTDNGEFAIIVSSLKDDQHNFFYQSNRSFPAASLYKLFLLSATMRQINSRTIEPDTVLTSSVDYLSDRLGEVDYGYENVSGDLSYTLEDCLKRIARLSDNFCAVMVADKIGWNTIQSEANQLGATQTIIKDPISTSPEDVSKYLTLLYQGKIVDATASAKIAELLTTNHSRDRIPGLLPQEIKIAHKTGELARLKHDAGIVYLPNHPYLIVMMSENLQGEDTAIDSMANISKAVYDYFVKLP